jgi:hypothetical protein
MNWIKSRLKERTTLDGVLMIAAGVALFIAPVNIIGGLMVAYGIYTTFMEG